MPKPHNCWHICTEGLQDRLIFRDREDFIQGMNAVALCSYKAPVAVLAFCLMDNHVHFVVNGTRGSCVRFVDAFVLRLAKWIRRKYGEAGPLRGVGINIKNIDSYVYLKDVISYVHRNPMVAGICAALSYEWSTAGTFFRQKSSRPGLMCISSLTARERRKRLKTKYKDIPPDMVVNSEDMILPESYVLARHVERLFSNAQGYMFSINTNKDVNLETLLAAPGRQAYDDSALLTVVPVICREEVGSADFAKLDIEDKCKVVGILRKRYGASLRQISRVTGLRRDYVSKLLGKS